MTKINKNLNKMDTKIILSPLKKKKKILDRLTQAQGYDDMSPNLRRLNIELKLQIPKTSS